MFKLTMYIFIYLLLSGCQPEQYNGPVAEKISHRGYDENKINGFIEAINDGYSILEADVRLRNNTPTLLHDDKACSDCSTLSELLELAQNKGIILFLLLFIYFI